MQGRTVSPTPQDSFSHHRLQDHNTTLKQRGGCFCALKVWEEGNPPPLPSHHQGAPRRVLAPGLACSLPRATSQPHLSSGCQPLPYGRREQRELEPIRTDRLFGTQHHSGAPKGLSQSSPLTAPWATEELTPGGPGVSQGTPKSCIHLQVRGSQPWVTAAQWHTHSENHVYHPTN